MEKMDIEKNIENGLFRNAIHYLIKYYSDLLDWYEISKNPNFLTPDPIQNDKIIKKYQDLIDWEYLSANPNFLTTTPNLNEIIEKYIDKIEWDTLIINPNFLFGNIDENNKIIKKYYQHIKFNNICCSSKFLVYNSDPNIQFKQNDLIIETYQDLIDWSYLS